MDLSLSSSALARRNEWVWLFFLELSLPVFGLCPPAYFADSFIYWLLSQICLTNMSAFFLSHQHDPIYNVLFIGILFRLRWAWCPALVLAHLKQLNLIQINNFFDFLSGLGFTTFLSDNVVYITDSQPDSAHFNHWILLQLNSIFLIEWSAFW